MVIEVFSCLMFNAVEQGKIKLIPSCRKDRISHLGYADDLIAFLYADIDSIIVLNSRK